ncbi:DUF4124 domain-containing protein [Denitromonas iodatirespirans]|uniref:DUF4124 domain-containing protein n=1 Tax=Denitromonas iodatirespirans TaxID=2795389 RepID=A0A944DG66_DENI1|nr:DUF4124 domain-containing protein [Denitromonas iodatirespirans]MBT0963748.1 DUF4124 domain-containing protein [Denitromonas iodatirespirans]
MRTRHSALFVLTLVALTAHAGQVFEWTDASGKRHFSDTPPSGVDAKPTGIRTNAPTPTAQPAGGAAQSTGGAPTTWAEKNADFAKRKAEQAENTAKANEEAEQARRKKEACEQATAQLKMLESGSRVQRINNAGEREVLDDAGRAEEIARTRDVIKQACDN